MSYRRLGFAEKGRYEALGTRAVPGRSVKPKPPVRALCELCLQWYVAENYAAHRPVCPGKPRRG